MNLMLRAEALREEGAVWGGGQTRRKKNSNSLFSMSFKELSHQRGKAALFLGSSSRSMPIHSLAYTPAISHTQDTHPGCFSLPHPRLSSLSIGLYLFLAAESHFLPLHRHCTKNPLNSLSLPCSLSLLCLSRLAVSKTHCNITSTLRWPVMVSSAG